MNDDEKIIVLGASRPPLTRQELRRNLRRHLRILRTKYGGRNRGRDCKLPPAAVTEAELDLVEEAARADGVSVSYIVRCGALTESKKRLRRAGLQAGGGR